MQPINPRPADVEVRTILPVVYRRTLSAAGFTVVQREPLLMLVRRLEDAAEIVSQYPRTTQATRLRPVLQNALYLCDLLLETR